MKTAFTRATFPSVLLNSLFFLLSFSCSAQTNVRAWYANGQVWVVWENTGTLPETYAIYAKPTPFTNTANATLAGRLFKMEYAPAALKEQVDTTATYRIPNGQGGMYQLKDNEGLFVATPHQPGALWFAVVKWGETTVTPGQNITQSIVQFQYNPVNDPVECHLQAVFPSPFAPGYHCFAYCMWADGRQNQWENRPDFPVMANQAKNGMPSLFLVSIPEDLDTTQPFPLTVWLHGGGGTAMQSLAGSRPIVHLNPEKGILLAHDDNLIGYRSTTPPNIDEPSWHFGWRKNYDPFSTDNIPTAVDTIVNYTQRRYLWIDAWLMRHFNIDPNRININGHSMGSAGTTALAKCYPDHYASATIFNNGFGGPTSNEGVVTFGPSMENFPTNLKNRAGEAVRFLDVFNLLDNCALPRDLPLIRSFHGKNDDNGTMQWDAYVVENYRKADSLGIGAQLMWSERSHGIDTGPDYNDHWFDGNGPTQQTVVDDVAYEETHFRSDHSYPAFFNNRLDPNANDPGTGLIGINNGDGDNWGSWGGYHRWDQDNITDTPGAWSVVAWLESNAVFGNDNCPYNNLKADLAIRRPQQFKPATGAALNWFVENMENGAILQSGNVVVQADDVTVIPQVTVFRENIRQVRISVVDPSVGIRPEPSISPFGRLSIEPNPSSSEAFLSFIVMGDMPVQIRAIGTDGRCTSFEINAIAGENRISLSQFKGLPSGVYFIEIRTNGHHQMVKMLKQ